jgi:hypothetical protein
MAPAQVIDGTPREIQDCLDGLNGNARLILIVPADAEKDGMLQDLHYATPDERARALDEIAEGKRMETVYRLLPDILAIYRLWRLLVDSYSVIGRQVYDARLVAVMQAHGITHLLTLDSTDFRRYSAIITIVEPRNVR